MDEKKELDLLSMQCINVVKHGHRITRSQEPNCNRAISNSRQNIDPDSGYSGDGGDDNSDYVDNDSKVISMSQNYPETTTYVNSKTPSEYISFSGSFDLEKLLAIDVGKGTIGQYFTLDHGHTVVSIDDDGFASVKTQGGDHSPIDDSELVVEEMAELTRNSPLNVESLELEQEPEDSYESDGLHLCDICGQNFTNMSTLSLHILTRHPDRNYARSNMHSEYINARTNPLNDLRADIPRSEAVRQMLGLNPSPNSYGTSEKFTKCEQCGMNFATKTAVKAHESVAHPSTARRFLCGDCGKSYTSSTSLNAHMSMVHRKQRCMCEVCGKYYASKYYLNLHRKIHSETKDYTCGFCLKAFIDQQALRLHLRTHTGERPYRCPECGLGFTQSSHLKTHSRLHTGEKPFSCKICGKLFRQQSNVMEHERTHMKLGFSSNR